MSNKKQIRLRTIQATNWIDPREAIKIHVSKELAPFRPKQISPAVKRQLQSAKNIRYLTQQSKIPEHNIKKVISSNVLNEKRTLKMFPKRESVIKNGNQYRYFLSYSKKVVTQPQPEEVEFQKKWKDLVSKGSISVQKGQLSMRRYTEACHGKKRNRPVRSEQISRKKNEQKLEPWFQKDEYDFEPIF